MIGELYIVIMGFVGVRDELAKITSPVVDEVSGELLKALNV